MINWTAILAAILIFLAGTVTGGLAVRLYDLHTRPRPSPDLAARPGWTQRMELLHRLDNQLALEPDQRTRIEQTLRESQERLLRIWDRFNPEARAELVQSGERIKTILTPSQREKYERLSRTRTSRRTNDTPLKDPRRDRTRPPASSRDPSSNAAAAGAPGLKPPI